MAPKGVERVRGMSAVLPHHGAQPGFAEDGLASIRTRAEWQEFLHEHYPWLESCGERSAWFEAEVACHRIQHNSLAFIRSTSTQVNRSMQLVQPSEAAYVQIVLQQEGSMEFEQGRDAAVIRSGQAFICDTARPYATRLSEGACFSVLTLPHAVLPGWSGISHAVCGQPLPDATSVLAAQGALSALLRAPGGAGSASVPLVMQAVQSMLSCALHRCAAMPAQPDRDTGRFQRVRDYIQDRLDDPDLGPDRLAEVLHMSRRAMYLLFKQHQTSPAALIQTMRLDACREALSDPNRRDHSITAVAGDHGFADLTTLSRAFKQRFGLSPNDWRRQALREEGPAP